MQTLSTRMKMLAVFANLMLEVAPTACSPTYILINSANTEYSFIYFINLKPLLFCCVFFSVHVFWDFYLERCQVKIYLL